MRMAVTGLHGQVVQSLIERANNITDVSIVPLGRPELDLQDTGTIDPALKSARPDVIVSAAAYTAVDRAESEQDVAMTVNGVAPGLLAATAKELGVPLIHISTDYVFDGFKDEPYREEDAVNPLGVYGLSKLAGEHAVRQATANHIILRTAWVYSPFGANFVKTMLRLAGDREELNVVGDQLGAPTNALDIADAVIGVARQMLARPDDMQKRGTFHLSGTGYTDWAHFAETIFEISATLGGPQAKINRIATSEYPTPARRPANSRLDNDKLRRNFSIVTPEWRESLPRVVQRLLV
ncbi:dTDP-4-dehydrorhamnose reductase [Sphingobium amiense]|uniref:dTDP-4-dehydrorhamnose reductase n=2 Tax=Sphingobium amiense TaxID=135719 RepID=A0A494W464_9SPHN|nr:dTDP-4-dehydrorhamnose reductase [Sphingobium amiense]BBD97387.1 dTDP-4-dehydrorhamnose reductase [Sphingobium amiense]